MFDRRRIRAYSRPGYFGSPRSEFRNSQWNNLQIHGYECLEFVQCDYDLANAHTFCSRSKAEEELESNIIYHYLIPSFRSLYGKTITPHWHFGNGPDQPPTRCDFSIEGLRQGDAPANSIFTILIARVYTEGLCQSLMGEGSSSQWLMMSRSPHPHMLPARSRMFLKILHGTRPS